jgi:hypothetical protein
VVSESRPGDHRAKIPFAIPYNTTHSDAANKTAVVSGVDNRSQILPLLETALNCTRDEYGQGIYLEPFDELTRSTYSSIGKPGHKSNFFANVVAAVEKAFGDPRKQYDKHSQVVFRVRDQSGQPVEHFSIFFNSFGGGKEGGSVEPTSIINELFEDRHKNQITPSTMNFYIRTESWDGKNRLKEIKGVNLEIDAIDPLTQRVMFLPVRVSISAKELLKWIEPHRTTIVDIELMRLPHRVTFVLRQA